MTLPNLPHAMAQEIQENRRTVIPTPRNESLFAGWGVKF